MRWTEPSGRTFYTSEMHAGLDSKLLLADDQNASDDSLSTSASEFSDDGVTHHDIQVCVCVFVCVFVCVCVCVCVQRHTYMLYVCMHVCVFLCMHVCMNVQMHTYVSCIHAYMHTNVHTFMHTYI